MTFVQNSVSNTKAQAPCVPPGRLAAAHRLVHQQGHVLGLRDAVGETERQRSVHVQLVVLDNAAVHHVRFNVVKQNFTAQCASAA